MSAGVITNVAFLWKCLVSSLLYYQCDDPVCYSDCIASSAFMTMDWKRCERKEVAVA